MLPAVEVTLLANSAGATHGITTCSTICKHFDKQKPDGLPPIGASLVASASIGLDIDTPTLLCPGPHAKSPVHAAQSLACPVLNHCAAGSAVAECRLRAQQMLGMPIRPVISHMVLLCAAVSAAKGWLYKLLASWPAL